MKLRKHIIWLLVFALLVPGLLPSKAAYAATAFTYAEQNTSIRVESLFLEPQEKVDLKFIGIKDYKNYQLRWTSTDEKVATVDSQGIITAKANGTAIIRLVVGNGANYTSKGVTVTVGTRDTVLLGTSKETANSSVALPLGQTVELKYFNVPESNASESAKRYTCQWSSINPDIATVNQNGTVTPHKEGIAIIMLSITDNFSGKQLKVNPIAINVVKAGQTTPTPAWTAPIPSPIPTPWWTTPIPSSTPTPTPWPTWTSPIPTSVPTARNYKVTLESSSSILLEFPSVVSYGKEDIHVYRIFKNGLQNLESEWGVKSVASDGSGTKLTVEAEIAFSNGETYIVRVGANDTGTEFTVSFGAPNRIVVTYECLGAEGVAYAQTSVDAPVTLSYRLYHDSLDVTKEYANSGYVEYEMLAPTDSFSTYLVGNELTFYEEKTTAVIRAIYHYGANYNTTLTSAPVSIISQPLGSYSLSKVEEWTIIDDTKRTAIDWKKPVHEVTAGEKNQKIVLLFSDRYGIRYSTDERGVDEGQGIYSMEDTTKLFAANNCTLGFASVSQDKIWVDEYSGSLEPFAAVTRAVVYVTYYNYQANGTREIRIGTLGIQIRKEAELASLEAETKAVTLVAEVLPGFEDRFCKTQVKINAFDQYGKPWEGDCILDLSCTTSEVNNALGSQSGPAYLDGTTLYIDAEAISQLTKRATVSFIVKEVMLKKNTTVTVSLKTPTKDKNGEITVNGWEIGVKDVSLFFSKEEAAQNTKYASVEMLKLSKSVQVGLYGNTSNIELTDDRKFTPTSGEVDDIFVLITAPDGKAVPIVATPNECGVYWDKESNSIHVIAAAPDKENSSTLTTLAPGRYTVKAMKITSILSSGKPSYTTKTATFTIVDDRPVIQFQNSKDTKTATYVSSQNDFGSVTSIIEELFSFTKGGMLWEDWTADMITDVDFTYRETTRYATIQIKSITFLVPAGEGSNFSYAVTVKGIGRTIRCGVDE